MGCSQVKSSFVLLKLIHGLPYGDRRRLLYQRCPRKRRALQGESPHDRHRRGIGRNSFRAFIPARDRARARARPQEYLARRRPAGTDRRPRDDDRVPPHHLTRLGDDARDRLHGLRHASIGLNISLLKNGLRNGLLDGLLCGSYVAARRYSAGRAAVCRLSVASRRRVGWTVGILALLTWSTEGIQIRKR